MPQAFTNCVKNGGRVRRITPKPGVYINICYPKGGGSPVRGEVHHTSGKSEHSEMAVRAEKELKTIKKHLGIK